VGVQGMFERLKAEAPRFTHIIPQLPRLVHRALSHAAEPGQVNDELLRLLVVEQQKTNRMLSFFVYFAVTCALGLLAFQVYAHGFRFP
jgi:ubiquinone biosynthesis protein